MTTPPPGNSGSRRKADVSVDYFLFSPGANRAVLIGSVGAFGVKSWPVEYGGREFIAWAIEESINDVRMVSERELPESYERFVPRPPATNEEDSGRTPQKTEPLLKSSPDRDT